MRSAEVRPEGQWFGCRALFTASTRARTELYAGHTAPRSARSNLDIDPPTTKESGSNPLTAEQEPRTSGSFNAVGSAGHLRGDQVGRIMASIDVSNTGSTRDEACAVPDESGYDHDELASDRDHICGLSATQFHKTKSSLDRCQQ